MKRCFLTLGAFAALTTTVAAQTDDVIVDGRIITGGDFDADGTDDIVILDPATGHFTAGFGHSSHPDFLWWPAARALPTGGLDGSVINFTGLEVAGGFNPYGGFQGGVRVAVGDVNGDGTDDYVLTSVQHPAVYVLPGSTTRENALTTFERHPLGAGPSGIAFAQLDARTPEPELAVPLIAGLMPRTVMVLPRVGWEVAVAPLDVQDPAQVSGFQNFALLAPGTTTGGGRHGGHLGAYVFRNSAGSLLRVAQFSSSAAPAISQHPEPWTHVLSADMRGANSPGQFVLWGMGLDSLRVVTATTPNGNTVAVEEIVIVYEGIVRVERISDPAGDRLAIVHHEGERMSVLRWNPATGQFTATQNLTAPAGRRFANVAGLGAGGLFALLDDGSYTRYGAGAGGLLTPAAQGVLPAMPAAGGHATVMLYTDDPLSGKAFEFESFLTGAWSRDAAFAGGNISAVSEIFQSTALGLGDPMNVLLTPAADPGPAGQAQGNQFGDASSSIFYAGGVSGDGNAAVQISPAPGSYGTFIQVKFTPAVAGTTVIYRVNGQAWQQAATGGFFLAADAVVEYYGQSAGGALGTIHSANYDIMPQFAADANGDGLPDALAASLGLDPGGDGDSDNDGVSDANELLNGSDPRNANSQPAALHVTLPPSLEIDISVQTPRGSGSLIDEPAAQARYTLFLADGTPLRSNAPVVNGTDSFTLNAALLPSTRADAPGRTEFQSALIFEVTIPAIEAEPRGTSLYGMAFAPAFVLPQLPEGETPSLTQWIDDTSAALGGATGGIWKTTNFDGSRTGPVLINADTTIGVAAFSAWLAHRLADAGVEDANFAWDHRGSRSDLPAHELAHIQQQLRAMERPANPGDPAFDPGAVARSFYNTIAGDATYEPLRIAAREMILREAARPGTVRRNHNAAQALLHFFDTGELESFYADAVTAPLPVLTALRAQLLGLPEPRAVREGTGLLKSLDGGGTWVVETAGGEVIALLDDRRIATAAAGGLTLQRLPAQPSDTGNTIYVGSANGGVWRNTVRVSGFILPDTEPRPPGTDSAIELLSLSLLDVDLRGDLNDTDGDRLDDAFEMRFFNTLAHSFDDDTDGDGYTDGEEYFLLGNPALAAIVPAGRPAIPHNIVTVIEDGPFTLAWDGRDDVTYAVQESLELGGWNDSLVAPREVAPGRYEWTMPDAGRRRFVRIVTEFE